MSGANGIFYEISSVGGASFKYEKNRYEILSVHEKKTARVMFWCK